MTFYLEGLLVSVGLLLVGFFFGGPVVIGLLGSLPFSATAIAQLGSLGASSPPIYTVFAILLLLVVAFRKHLFRDLASVVSHQPVSWVLITLGVYSIAGAIILPRLFAGQTSIFLPINRIVTEVPLMPSSGNVSQTAFFILGILIFLAVRIVLKQRENLTIIRRGFFAFVIIHITLGLVDLTGKLFGAGNVLAAIRTASYVDFTDVVVVGFWRITGGHSEASTYGGQSLVCLAFLFAYWRATKSILALTLMLPVAALLFLSTSSTAYAGFLVLVLIMLLSMGLTFFKGGVRRQDLILLAIGAVALAATVATFLYSARSLEPFGRLLQIMFVEKLESGSAQERIYWNYKSLQSFYDTFGLGIGMGSSRSSSWIISTIAQLGILGSVMVFSVVGVLFRGMRGLRPVADNVEIFAIAAGARAAGVAQLIFVSISGSGANPNIFFFIALATLCACRAHASSPPYGVAAWQKTRISLALP